jgi:hypothetical protein
MQRASSNPVGNDFQMTSPSSRNPHSRVVSHSPQHPSPSGSSLPRLKIPLQSPPPCCLCSAIDFDGLLPVCQPSSPRAEDASPRRASVAGQALESLRVHEACAQAIPETWVTESNGQKYVYGVNKVVKDRWTLVSLCVRCTSRGILIQILEMQLVLQGIIQDARG